MAFAEVGREEKIAPASESSAEPATKLPRPMRIFLEVNAAATALCLLIEFACRRLGYPEVYFNPFFVGYRFFDFDSFRDRFQFVHQAAFFALDKPFPFSYPAPAALIYVVFFSFGDAGLNVFLGCMTALLVALTVLFARALVRRGMSMGHAFGWCFATLLLAFPFWFLFQRGNVEIVPFLIVAAGVWCFATGRGYRAAVCFGLAASIKAVPILYLALLFSRRQYKQVAVGVVVAVLANVSALWFIGPTVEAAWVGIGKGAEAFHFEFVRWYQPDSIGFDHSILGIYRRFIGTGARFSQILQAYTIVAATWGTGLYFLRIRRMPMLNQFFVITVAAIWLPPVSFEYTLTQIYLCVGLMVLAGLENKTESWARMMPFFVLCGLLASPSSEFILHQERFGGQVKSVLLLLLFALSLIRPLASRLDESDFRIRWA